MRTYTYFAQPIVEIDTAKVTQNELLLRAWDADQNAWRLPDSFEITVAMQIQLLQHTLPRLDVKNVAINLTPTQFAQTETMAQLIQFTQQSSDLGVLTIELTSAPTLMEIRTIGAQYRAAGIQIAIDDVGSDIDDYAMVEQLAPHVDEMKFALQNLRDRDMMADAIARIKKWRTLTRIYRTRFVFEGVESIDDVELAQQFKIHEAQGFYYSRPAKPI